jgi:ferredoxin
MRTESRRKRLVRRRQFLGFTCLALSAAWAGCRKPEDTGVAPGPRIVMHGTNTPPSKWPDNVAGRFYVTSDCIDCDLCRETAPALFNRNNKEGYCFVYKQPGSAAELSLCREAAEGCPVEAIVDTLKPINK